jgi:hypothetical protein
MATSAAPAPMARRSWYLSKAVADRLAEAVDDIYFTTRRPKHEVLAEILAEGLEHRDAVEARLTGRRTRP